MDMLLKKKVNIIANDELIAVQVDNTDRQHQQEGGTIEMRNRKKISTPNNTKQIDMTYYIDQTPPWYLCIVLGIQQYLIMFGGTISIPLILAPALCMTNTVHISELISTCFVVSGINTIIQVMFGVRLPIVQGGSFAFLNPILALLSLEKWQCPVTLDNSVTNTSMLNMTNMNTSIAKAQVYDDSEVWKLRIREIQGAIIIASLLQVLMAVSGLFGLLLKYIGPIVTTPTIILIGLALIRSASRFCSTNWWVAIMTIVLIILFSQYLRNIDFPCCTCYKRIKCTCKAYPVFRTFPIFLGICVSWIICAILTVTNAIPNDKDHWAYKARTDTKSDVLIAANWIILPYPGQWGLPTFSAAGIVGMMSAIVVGMVKGVSDYYICARISGAPPPPVHAINRGILIEGFGSIICGLWGTAGGTTSYSQNIASIGITKASSTSVILYAAAIMIILGILGKFGALFVIMPDAILGGLFMVIFGMLTGVGLSNLQSIDLNSSRNLFIIGFSLFIGLSLPDWVQNPEHAGAISTGNITIDQIITSLLRTSMFVGGTVACILDNTVPGTDEERGMVVCKQKIPEEDTSFDEEGLEDDLNIYNLPCGMSFINKWQLAKYIPISPTFKGFSDCSLFKLKKRNEMG